LETQLTADQPTRKITDQEYLKNQQYRTDANLQARIALHRKYGTNPGSWFRWVYDHLSLPAQALVMEAGCGPGDLWYENRDRLPKGARVLLGDLSTGMVTAARAKNAFSAGMYFLALDAQNIPLPSASLDCVIANHMLYHVPDMEAAILEFRRVLKPGGLFCAATNGLNHMRQIYELVHRFKPAYEIPLLSVRRFALENGPGLLRRYFSQVHTEIYEENLRVTNASDLIAYIASMWHLDTQVDQQTLERLSAYTQDVVEKYGSIYIEKSQGIIMAAV
jgi:SAM-dependent methyltransferase